MPINFPCAQCTQQLTVPDSAAGKTAACPACGKQQVVPSAASPAQPFFIGSDSPSPSGEQSPWEFRDQATARPKSPFGSSPFASTSSDNPYAPPSPQSSPFALKCDLEFAGEIQPQQVGMGDILQHTNTVFQRHLGVLFLTMLVFLAINFCLSLLVGGMSTVMQGNRRPGLEDAMLRLVLQIPLFAIQTFLGIGLAQICLKLARQKRASVFDLFGGGRQFWPVLGATLLVMLFFTFTAMVTLGLAFAASDRQSGPTLGVCSLMAISLVVYVIFWPFHYLLVEGKASVLGAFPLAAKITSGNRLTMFVLLLLLGFAFVAIAFGSLLCTGLGGGRTPFTIVAMVVILAGLMLFSSMFLSQLMATSYLMCSGQISARPRYERL